MNKIKDNTMNFIIDEALKLFMKKSIASVTMTEIAKEVGIGDATLYRYFKKKQNIVLASIVKLSDDVLRTYFSLDDKLSGIDSIKAFYGAYLEVYKEHKQYFKLIYEFDAYLISEKNVEKLEYEREIDCYKNIFLNCYHKAILDKTINEIKDVDVFYYSTTHSLLSLCKMLSIDNVIAQDASSRKEDEIRTLISIIINFLA